MDGGALKRKTRSILSKDQVLEIYRLRDMPKNPGSVKIAARYGVSEKAIRDIWKARTWAKETWHLESSRPLSTRTFPKKNWCRTPTSSSESADDEKIDVFVGDAQGQILTIEQAKWFHRGLAEVNRGHLPESDQKDDQIFDDDQRCQYEQFVRADFESIDGQLCRWDSGEQTLSDVMNPFINDWKIEQISGLF